MGLLVSLGVAKAGGGILSGVALCSVHFSSQ
jgi:hypothetical protein